MHKLPKKTNFRLSIYSLKMVIAMTVLSITAACSNPKSEGPRQSNEPIDDSIGLDQEFVGVSVATNPSPKIQSDIPKLPAPPWSASSRLTESTPGGVGEQWGTVAGVKMFRGNPTRTFYGTGPLPTQSPRLMWRYPDKPMCSISCIGNGTGCKQWCGSGWTGQPVVYERADGITEIIFGAYDRHVHFLNAATGKPTRPSFPTGDIIKGSVTLDPDGYPLLYFGSRDNKYRILALDRDVPTEIYHIDAYQVRRRLWNDDWDGNGAIVADRLFIGGENSWFYVIKLNRAKDPSTGKVVINPVTEVQMPGWTEEMLQMLHPKKQDTMLSIESSPVVIGPRAYWTNSGGMVVGIDWTRVKNQEAEVVFTYWAGDDIDATPVVDERGHLYVAVEKEFDNGRRVQASLKRTEEAGQLIKLDPSNPKNPVLWKVAIPARLNGDKGGIWSTPALDLKRNALIVTTHPGDLISFDRMTGKEMWRKHIGSHEWGSPIVIGDQLLVGRCAQAGFELFELNGDRDPVTKWTTKFPTGCVESTPAVWKGHIYVGSRDGYFYGFAP